MCAAKSHVRFTPDSDRESEFSRTVMSALPPKADMCGLDENLSRSHQLGSMPLLLMSSATSGVRRKAISALEASGS